MIRSNSPTLRPTKYFTRILIAKSCQRALNTFSYKKSVQMIPTKILSLALIEFQVSVTVVHTISTNEIPNFYLKW